MTVAPRHYRASPRRVVMTIVTRALAMLIVCMVIVALVVMLVEG